MPSIIEIVAKIQKKKELAGLSSSIVTRAVAQYMKKIPINQEQLTPRQEKLLIKEVRAELRSLTGQFQKSAGKRQYLFEHNDILNLLKTHTSTAERLSFYPQLKKIIHDLKARSILDLGCGLNPIALAEPALLYYALDIKEDELALVKRFFDKNKINGEVKIADLRTLHANELPSADICLLFKVLDLIEQKGHKRAEALISAIPCRYILASFSTKTLSGKSMNHPQRGWIEQLSKRLGFSFTLINSRNEIFYLIEKPIIKKI